MTKKKKTGNDLPLPPEPASEALATPGPTLEPQETVSKADAARAAIEALGPSVPVTAYQAWIREKYNGLEVGAANIYQIKNKNKGSTPLKASGGAKRVGCAASHHPLTLENIQQAKALLKDLGPDGARSLLDTLDSN